MNQIEKDEIKQLPAKYRPLTAWSYFGYTILFSIPLVGFILLIVFSFSSDNINRRSFARSYFCVIILGLILMGIAILTGTLSEVIASIGQ